jgi:hypothetical protein
MYAGRANSSGRDGWRAGFETAGRLMHVASFHACVAARAAVRGRFELKTIELRRPAESFIRSHHLNSDRPISSPKSISALSNTR